MSDIKRQQLLDKRDSLLPDYRIDLILSDLSKPGYQQSGFYDLTETNPYHDIIIIGIKSFNFTTW